MKKKFAVLMALLLIVTGVILPCGVSAVAATYFPTTPIEYDQISTALFSRLDLTTGSNNFHENDNWKYYYRCSFTPQYSADYTVKISAKKKMKTELYDAQDNLLSSSYAPDEPNNGLYYEFSNTYYLEKGKTYYYEFAFTNGYFNSCGPFSVYMTSSPAAEIPSDDYLHLYVNGKKSGSVYELDSYSPQQLISDMSMRAVYSDGKLYEWNGKDTVIPYLNGCDIILDLSDCAAQTGVHTVRAHFMGREVTASFEIVDCIHSYVASSKQEASWLQQGCTVYTCTKCSESISADIIPRGADVYADFFDYFNASSTDDDYNEIYDVNSDGHINTRDYVLIRKMKQEAENGMLSAFNKRQGQQGYDSVYDLNSDGVINARDVAELNKTLPVPD